jgi:hypothetical protein
VTVEEAYMPMMQEVKHEVFSPRSVVAPESPQVTFTELQEFVAQPVSPSGPKRARTLTPEKVALLRKLKANQAKMKRAGVIPYTGGGDQTKIRRLSGDQTKMQKLSAPLPDVKVYNHPTYTGTEKFDEAHTRNLLMLINSGLISQPGTLGIKNDAFTDVMDIINKDTLPDKVKSQGPSTVMTGLISETNPMWNTIQQVKSPPPAPSVWMNQQVQVAPPSTVPQALAPPIWNNPPLQVAPGLPVQAVMPSMVNFVGVQENVTVPINQVGSDFYMDDVQITYEVEVETSQV